jgi:hypothetical protein
MRGVGINPTRDQHPPSRIRVANAKAARSAPAQHFGERDARCPSDSATVGGDRDQRSGDPSDRHAPDVGGNHVDSAEPGHDDSLDTTPMATRANDPAEQWVDESARCASAV